jgi:membrane protein implicated in regulation of membrane protease activity
MRSKFLVVLNVANAIMLMDITHAGQALMMFIFVGAIPGTNLSLPPELMLLLNLSIAGAIVFKTFKKQILRRYKKLQKSYKQLKIKRAKITNQPV